MVVWCDCYLQLTIMTRGVPKRTLSNNMVEAEAARNYRNAKSNYNCFIFVGKAAIIHIMSSLVLRILTSGSLHSQHSQTSALSPTGSHWSRRTRRSRDSYENGTVQTINGSWIDGRKLVELLNDKFGRHYKLQVGYSLFNVSTVGLLPSPFTVH